MDGTYLFKVFLHSPHIDLNILFSLTERKRNKGTEFPTEVGHVKRLKKNKIKNND